jgi:hypothetical protein
MLGIDSSLAFSDLIAKHKGGKMNWYDLTSWGTDSKFLDSLQECLTRTDYRLGISEGLLMSMKRDLYLRRLDFLAVALESDRRKVEKKLTKLAKMKLTDKERRWFGRPHRLILADEL